MKFLKTVKLIGTKRYEVEMLQTDRGQYIIRFLNRAEGGHQYVENLDFPTAQIVFQQKCAILEGN